MRYYNTKAINIFLFNFVYFLLLIQFFIIYFIYDTFILTTVYKLKLKTRL